MSSRIPSAPVHPPRVSSPTLRTPTMPAAATTPAGATTTPALADHFAIDTGPATVGTPAHPIARKLQFIYELPPGVALEAVMLKGSWSTTGAYSQEWEHSRLPMKETPPGSGVWQATVELLDDGQPHPWRWGVDVTHPTQRSLEWGMAAIEGVPFALAGVPVVRHTPVTYQFNGARRSGLDDLSFRAWFPHADAVVAKITLPETGQVVRVPLSRDPEKGWWHGLLANGFDAHEGQPYVYELKVGGKTIEKVDMYALELQGEQRGLRPFFITRRGAAANEFSAQRDELLWFNVDEDLAGGARELFLVLKDASGHALSRDELRARVGNYDAGLVGKAREGKFNDFWDQPGSVSATGRIRMTELKGSFSTLMNSPAALEGLRYEFQSSDGLVLGDANHDGRLSVAEGLVSPNDPWDNTITSKSWKDPRLGIIRDALKPAPPRAATPSSVIYQAHPGSFMSASQNVDRSTFEDLIAHLDYLKGLGVTDIQILPPAEVGGMSWGYEGVSSLATESGYGFVEGTGADRRWVSGREAFRRFVDEAHAKGLNVIADVVLNHLYEPVPQRWMQDGGSDNDWFNQRTNAPPGAPPRYFETAWGTAPAFNNPAVAQFLTDYVLGLALEMGVDGVRFDFTQPIIDAGGADLLKRINSLLSAFNVKTRIAENFPYQQFITEEIGRGGLGFSDQLYVSPNHLLIDDNRNRSVLAQAALRTDDSEIDVDSVMGLLTSDPEQFARGWASATVGLTTHDEVGNGARMISVAQGYRPKEPPDPWAVKAVRLMHGIGALGPGARYMIFEGEESLASNSFRWGEPSTWSEGKDWLELGRDWDWEGLRLSSAKRSTLERLLPLANAEVTQDSEYQALGQAERKVLWALKGLPDSGRVGALRDLRRRQTTLFVKDVLEFRKSVLGASGGRKAGRVYTHKRDGVMAFRRKAEGGDVVVVANLSRKNYQGYDVHLPVGRWKEVLNSDGAKYGGDDFGNGGGVFSQGQAINIPQGGVVVFRQVP